MPFDTNAIKEIFVREKLKLVIGYSKGTFCFNTAPRLFSDVREFDAMVFNSFCGHNLATYVISAYDGVNRLGILVKPCDGKSLVELVRENKILREKLAIISLPCAGIIDTRKLFSFKKRDTEFITGFKTALGKARIQFEDRSAEADLDRLLENKCLKCSMSQSPVYDYSVGDTLPAARKEAGEAETGRTEKEKRSFWIKEYSRCIRCGACRSVCPMCYCDNCALERSGKMLKKEINVCENGTFLMIRAMHLAGRCVACGRCSRVCPVSIHHEGLYAGISKYILKTFDFDPGKNIGKPPVLAEAKLQEKEDFGDA